ncbi:MAG: cell division protein FtsA [Candidatus Saccharibacteria bacterium]|nr:cell division protein FtsA [Candidatus Saccharibacteria bacterium]
MDENTRYVAGIDVGSENIRAVVATVGRDGSISVVGYNEGKNAGMQKGMVDTLSGPAEAVDKMLLEVERMSGFNINSAFVSINGSNVMSIQADGRIALGTPDHEITEEDLDRVEGATVLGKIPANREILDVLPLSYTLDGQSGIKDPLGMTGLLLEMRANVISALMPTAVNLRKSLDGATITAEKLVPSVMAAASAVLTEKQRENGVAVVDLGYATTGVAIYENGDLQYVGVIPVGANNITNDLAILLQVPTEVAEDIKRRFVTGLFKDDDKEIVVKKGHTELAFSRKEVNRVVRDRLDEIFAGVANEIKLAGYAKKLPEGIVLVGGGAKMRDLDVYAKSALGTATRIGIPTGFGGIADAIAKPEYASAIGLALLASRSPGSAVKKSATKKSKGKKEKTKPGLLKKLFGKF